MSMCFGQNISSLQLYSQTLEDHFISDQRRSIKRYIHYIHLRFNHVSASMVGRFLAKIRSWWPFLQHHGTEHHQWILMEENGERDCFKFHFAGFICSGHKQWNLLLDSQPLLRSRRLQQQRNFDFLIVWEVLGRFTVSRFKS